jgi:hypothetical protein
MAKNIVTYQPQLSVTLTKIIRYKNGEAQPWVADRNIVDLTAYLGEAGGVTTYKSVRDQAGTFTITFADKMDQKTQDSLYALISPMDYIDMRMSRNVVQPNAQGRLPIVMRGFVSSVKRSQEMGDDGIPRRFVTITGMDFGKILGMVQVFYEQNYGFGQDLLTVFSLYANSAVGGSAIPAPQFLQAVLDKIINPFLETFYHKTALSADSGIDFMFKADVSAVKEGVIQAYTFQSYQGDIWGLLKDFSDRYWNELFVQDRDDGVYLVYRPLPFKDIDGKFIGDATDPGSTVITPADVKTINLERSDRDIANYFWVNAPQFQLIDMGTLQMDAYDHKDDYFLQDRADCDPTLYGIRKMQADTQQGNTSETTSGANQDTAKQAKSNSLRYAWVNDRRETLIEINQDNVIFDEGELVIKGNEAIQAGSYIVVDYGPYKAEFYAYAITQDFRPMQHFITTAKVIRGTSFLNRNTSSLSPYLAEQGSGLYA